MTERERQVFNIIKTNPVIEQSELARRLGISRTTIYQLIADGQIRTFKVGTRTLVPEADLRRFIADKLGENLEAAA